MEANADFDVSMAASTSAQPIKTMLSRLHIPMILFPPNDTVVAVIESGGYRLDVKFLISTRRLMPASGLFSSRSWRSPMPFDEIRAGSSVKFRTM